MKTLIILATLIVLPLVASSQAVYKDGVSTGKRYAVEVFNWGEQIRDTLYIGIEHPGNSGVTGLSCAFSIRKLGRGDIRRELGTRLIPGRNGKPEKPDGLRCNPAKLDIRLLDSADRVTSCILGVRYGRIWDMSAEWTSHVRLGFSEDCAGCAYEKLATRGCHVELYINGEIHTIPVIIGHH